MTLSTRTSRISILPLATLILVSSGASSSLYAQSSPFPLQLPPRPTEQGRVVGWGRLVLGANDCNVGFKSVAGGRAHSLALKNDGSVIAWGDNRYAECTIPEPNANWIAVAAGEFQSIGLKADGTVVSWGSPTGGPVPNADFVAIAAGESHALALRRDGSVAAWGENYAGQLNVPDSGFIQIAAGSRHSMGLKPNGSIVTWGCGVLQQDYGQCDVPAPNTDFVFIAAGLLHSLGIKGDGSIVAWGNSDGSRNLPEPNRDFVFVSGGAGSSLGIKSDGSLYTWGQGSIPPPDGPFTIASSGQFHRLAIRPNGAVAAWGNNSDGQCDVPPPSMNFISAAATMKGGSGLRSDGRISVWGQVPVVPSPNRDFVAIGRNLSSGYSQNLWAFRSDGSFIQWGNQSRSLPPGSPYVAAATSWGPTALLRNDGVIVMLGCPSAGAICVLPSPNADFTAIALSDSFGVGLKANGSVVHWGSTPMETLGTEFVPFVAISAGATHSMGLKKDGSIVGWGYPPTNVPEPNKDFVAISAGFNHSMGLKSDGSIVAWGDNTFGQLIIPQPDSGYIALSGGNNVGLAIRRVEDCNHNDRPDSCDIEVDGMPDVDADGIPDECQPPLTLDIRPGACPNVLNIHGRYSVQIAIVATPRVVVSEIDLDSLSLQRADGQGESLQPDLGFRNSRAQIVDLATPTDGSACACNRTGPDGLDDVLIEFPSSQVMRKLALDGLPPGTSVELVVTGSLLDGTPFEVSDCILTAGEPRRRADAKQPTK